MAVHSVEAAYPAPVLYVSVDEAPYVGGLVETNPPALMVRFQLIVELVPKLIPVVVLMLLNAQVPEIVCVAAPAKVTACALLKAIVPEFVKLVPVVLLLMVSVFAVAVSVPVPLILMLEAKAATSCVTA